MPSCFVELTYPGEGSPAAQMTRSKELKAWSEGHRVEPPVLSSKVAAPSLAALQTHILRYTGEEGM